MSRRRRIGIAVGDPADVGAEIICRALANLPPEPGVGAVVFGTRAVLKRTNNLTGAGLWFVEADADAAADGSVPVVDISVRRPPGATCGARPCVLTRCYAPKRTPWRSKTAKFFSHAMRRGSTVFGRKFGIFRAAPTMIRSIAYRSTWHG